MADEKTQPTLAELEGKVVRLTTDATTAVKAEVSANDAFARAVKSGDVDKALELADARTKAQSVASKSASQLKSAQSAVASAKHAQNADKIASIHSKIRLDATVESYVRELGEMGVTRITIERSEETGKLVINSTGPNAPKRQRSSNGGSRGTASYDVGGKSYTSRELIDAHPDMLGEKTREHYNSGNFRAFSMTREAERIHKQLTEA